MTNRPYTRSLDPQDYAFLSHAEPLLAFERTMQSPHCLWHEHKIWENASIMQQLDELDVPKTASVIDVGSGGMFFPIYLASVGGYKNLTLTDSMHARSDLQEMVREQCREFDLHLPLHELHAEDMLTLASESFDVVMCISVIEHIRAKHHDAALREMWRLTKPGGLLFITSDYFRSGADGHEPEQLAASPYRKGQRTAYHKELVLDLPRRIDADFVGGTDLDYRGDFVHNYSFVNICLRRTH
jgi:SAM-dependent methyltransferase